MKSSVVTDSPSKRCAHLRSSFAEGAVADHLSERVQNRRSALVDVRAEEVEVVLRRHGHRPEVRAPLVPVRVGVADERLEVEAP